MEFGIFNLMGSRTPEKPTAEVFGEVAEQTRLADELGYAIAWARRSAQPPADPALPSRRRV
jgi:alkanesulfonate monooxygenase SsuD/methylene tetrahydromethanopterin reductase-like flavin-dependent oxidoreductase (luciferase family)